MQRRIFVAISLPEDVKKRLFQRVQKWLEFPIKFTNQDNFHVTLSFLGFLDDSMLPEVCQSVKEALEGKEGFEIEFERIELGPNREKPNIVWLVGEANKELKELQEDIEKSLDIFVSEKKNFRPHVTLGKIRKHKWEAFPEKPKIEENFRISIPVESVEILESKIENGKRKYDVLESCEIK